jgi:hypothetical protein
MIFSQIVNRKPICPTLVTDPTLRSIIVVAGLIVSLIVLYKILRRFNEP